MRLAVARLGKVEGDKVDAPQLLGDLGETIDQLARVLDAARGAAAELADVGEGTQAAPLGRPLADGVDDDARLAGALADALVGVPALHRVDAVGE